MHFVVVWYKFLFMENCAPTIFLKSLALVAPYLCFKFGIFNSPFWKNMFFQVEKGPYLIQSCLGAIWNSLNPLVIKKMHLSFEILTIIDTPNLQASLMDIHHDTSFRSILKNDSIFLAFRTWIRFCLGKRLMLWLITRPFICLFYITHFIFTSTCIFILV